MENFKFITDSSSDLTHAISKELNIDIVPMGIVVDGKCYQEGVDFTNEEFYEILGKQKKIPTSAAINPHSWYEVMEKNLLTNLYDHIVVVTVGKALSSSYDAAVSAKEKIFQTYPDLANKLNIDIFDSGSASIGYGFPIIQAIKKLKDGISYAEVTSYLDDWFHSLEVYFVAFSFDIAKKSGRINGTTAYIGEKLNLRPVMQNIDGVFSLYSKVRGNRHVPAKLLAIAKDRMRAGSEYILLNGTQPNVCEDIHTLMKEHFGYNASITSQPGPAMVINGGPEMFCLGFLGKNRIK